MGTLELKSAKDLIEEFPNATVDEKNYLIETWGELYYQSKGKQPTSYDLVMLADWLLADELKNVSSSKVQNTEYPILSKSQIKTRYKEMSMSQEIVDVLYYKKSSNQSTRKRDAKNTDY